MVTTSNRAYRACSVGEPWHAMERETLCSTIGFFGILLSFPLVIMRRHVYNQPSFETEQRPGAVAPSRV